MFATPLKKIKYITLYSSFIHWEITESAFFFFFILILILSLILATLTRCLLVSVAIISSHYHLTFIPFVVHCHNPTKPCHLVFLLENYL